jgi:hypothetical protein
VDSGSSQSGCSKRTGIRFPNLSPYPQKIALLQGFCEWAMLGSNQRPPPCKGDERGCGVLQWLAESVYLS